MKICLNFFLLIALASGCQPIYRANVINTPLFHEKGETQLSLHGATSGTNFQGAYSVTDHIALFANGVWADNTSDSTDDFNRHELVEWGGGYYNHFGGGFVVEAFGGIGFGSAENYNNYWTDNYHLTTGKYQKYFFQPGLGFSSDIVDVGFTPRITFLNYYEISTNNGTQIEAPGRDLFFEPALTGRIGFKYVKLTSQLGIAAPLGNLEYEYQFLNFSLGVQLNIARRFWENN